MNALPEDLLPPARPVALPPEGEPGIDLRVHLMTLWRGKWTVLVITTLAALLSLIAAARLEPVWQASAKVLFDPGQARVIDLKEVMANPDFDKDSLQNQIEVLNSTGLIERVIAVAGLERSPEFNPDLRPEPAGLAALLASIPATIGTTLADLGLIAPPEPAPDPEVAARLRRLAMIAAVRERLTLVPVLNSRVIEIGFSSADPALSARLVNGITEQYIFAQLDAKLAATRSATLWLSDRVEELRTRVEADEAAVEEARAALALRTGQGSDITRQQIQALSASLTTAQSTEAAIAARLAGAAAALEGGGDLATVSAFRDSPVIAGFRERVLSLSAQRAVLAPTVPRGHPALARLDAQIAEMTAGIRAEAGRIVAALDNDRAAAEAQAADLAAELRGLEITAQDQAKGELQLRALEREAQASKVLYETFLGRMKETSEQEDLQTADARVISPAEVPLEPETGRARVIVAGGTLLGLLLGIGLVGLREALDTGIRGPAGVEALTGLPLLGALPATGRRRARAAVLAELRDHPASALAEAVRNLRTSILFSNPDRPPRVVMFTSSVPGEGKTTTAMLMAMTSRQMGRSAIIVDCDLRLPALSDLMAGTGGGAGLAALLEGRVDLEAARVTDPASGLDILMSRPGEGGGHDGGQSGSGFGNQSGSGFGGQSGSGFGGQSGSGFGSQSGSGFGGQSGSGFGNQSAADILASPRFRSLIRDLASRYDLVILDTPPALVVADPRIVAGLADAVVFALRWDHTPRGAVQEALRELRGVGAPLAGVVLTLVDEAKAGRHADGQYGYYRGRYRDYYAQS